MGYYRLSLAGQIKIINYWAIIGGPFGDKVNLINNHFTSMNTGENH